jgi:hypothetical protein
VLLARSPAEAERAGVNFVYQLPGLEMALRVEDCDEDRLLIDCGEQDPTRVHEHLKRLRGRDLRLSKDDRGTSRQIERAGWALR